MFVARKKQKKETPQWKLDMEAAAADASAGSSSKPPPPAAAAPTPAAPPPTPDPPPEARPAISTASTHEPPSPSDAWSRAAPPDDDDDDDDDDDFDASKYDLGGGEDEKDDEPEGRPCTVKVTGISHETTGDDLRAFFSEYGSVSKVLRAVDVRDRTAFLTFESPAAAAAACAAGRNGGTTLQERELSVELAPDAPSAPPRAAGWAAAEQRARLERDDPREGIGLKVAGKSSVKKPHAPGGVLYSGDHAPGGKQKQGREAAYGMPSSYPPGGPGGAPAGGWRTMGNGSRMPPGIEPAAGDWQCRACQNWNWARRISCNKCGQSKVGR